MEAERLAVENAHRGNRLRDLLPVGADVLDGTAADHAWNPGQALDAAETLVAGNADEVIPVEARGNVVNGEVLRVLDARLACQGDLHNHTRKAVVRDNEIGTSAQREQRNLAKLGEANGLQQLRLGGRAKEETGRAADLERGERREGHLLL